MDILKRLVEGYIKAGYPKKVAGVMRDVGDLKITALTVFRTPISSAINTLVNALSLNTFNKYKKSKGYDDFMHLYAVVKLSNNQSFLIEKNEVINVDGRIPKTTDKTQSVNVPVSNLTLNELLENARKKVGDHDFFVYSGIGGNNCQSFIKCLLKSSGILTPELDAFIKQDVESYAKEHGLLTRISNGITSVAGALNKAGNSMGLYKEGGYIILPHQHKAPRRRFG